MAIARYAERTGFPVHDVVWYQAWGAFKLAVILQQIYIRWLRGQTQDRRFAPLIDRGRTITGLLGRRTRHIGLPSRHRLMPAPDPGQTFEVPAVIMSPGHAVRVQSHRWMRRMLRREQLDLENMSTTGLREFHDRMVRRILCVNGLWLLFVVIVMFWSLNIGAIFVIITAIKYWYDYNDTESLTIYDSLLSLISSILARKGEDRNNDN